MYNALTALGSRNRSSSRQQQAVLLSSSGLSSIASDHVPPYRRLDIPALRRESSLLQPHSKRGVRNHLRCYSWCWGFIPLGISRSNYGYDRDGDLGRGYAFRRWRTARMSHGLKQDIDYTEGSVSTGPILFIYSTAGLMHFGSRAATGVPGRGAMIRQWWLCWSVRIRRSRVRGCDGLED